MHQMVSVETLWYLLSVFLGPHEAPVTQGGDQRLLQAQQQASRSGQPMQPASMGFQGAPMSQHGAPAPNQGLAPPTQNTQSQHTHLPPHPHHLQSTPPPSNQASHSWAPPPLASHPLSSPPLTPQKVPHIQVSLHKHFDVVTMLQVCEIKTMFFCFCVWVFFMCMCIFHVGGGNVCVHVH